MNTLLLDTVAWDLTVDSSGDIAMASDPYSIAQDVASAIRVFLGEAYYDTTAGVNYFGQILGQTPPLPVFKSAMVQAALTVPEVISATCIIEAFANRQVTGQVTFTTATGTASVSL